MSPPTFDQLRKHLDRYGPEGILESANKLPEEEVKELERLVKQRMKSDRKKKKK